MLTKPKFDITPLKQMFIQVQQQMETACGPLEVLMPMVELLMTDPRKELVTRMVTNLCNCLQTNITGMEQFDTLMTVMKDQINTELGPEITFDSLCAESTEEIGFDIRAMCKAIDSRKATYAAALAFYTTSLQS